MFRSFEVWEMQDDLLIWYCQGVRASQENDANWVLWEKGLYLYFAYSLFTFLIIVSSKPRRFLQWKEAQNELPGEWVQVHDRHQQLNTHQNITSHSNIYSCPHVAGRRDGYSVGWTDANQGLLLSKAAGALASLCPFQISILHPHPLLPWHFGDGLWSVRQRLWSKLSDFLDLKTRISVGFSDRGLLESLKVECSLFWSSVPLLSKSWDWGSR
jgi:hypothetical protein